MILKNSLIMSYVTRKELRYVLCNVNASSATKTKFDSPSVISAAGSLFLTYLLLVYHKMWCFYDTAVRIPSIATNIDINEVTFSIHNCEQNNTTVIFVVIKIRSTSGGFHCSNVFPIYRACFTRSLLFLFYFIFLNNKDKRAKFFLCRKPQACKMHSLAIATWTVGLLESEPKHVGRCVAKIRIAVSRWTA
jgi:hypothetical protein